MREFKVVLRNRRWQVRFLPHLSEGSYGECDPPDRAGKQIRIALNQSESAMLDTVVHEALHACLPDLNEESVLETATDIVSLLRRLGIKGIKKEDLPNGD